MKPVCPHQRAFTGSLYGLCAMMAQQTLLPGIWLCIIIFALTIPKSTPCVLIQGFSPRFFFYYFQSLPLEISKTFPLEQWQIAARQLKHRHSTAARYCSDWGIPLPWYTFNGLFHFSFKNVSFMHSPEPWGTLHCQSCSLNVITEARLR